MTEIAVPAELVSRHGLGPLAARAGATAFKSDLARSTIEWARIAQALPPIVTALREATIPVIPIKGVSYATGLYVVPAERPMTDVDLLVRPEDYRRARGVLADLGFQPDVSAPLHHASCWLREDLVVDLHRSIVGAGRARVDLDLVWKRASPGWPTGAARLEPVDEVVFHLVHMGRNRLCGPLIHVVDAAKLVARVGSAEPALLRARAWGLGTLVDRAWRFSANVLADTARPGGWIGPSTDDVLALRQPPTWKKLVFDLAVSGSARQAAARIAGYVVARPAAVDRTR